MRLVERRWRVRQLKATARIDACVAGAMAYARAAQNEGGCSYVMALDRLEDSAIKGEEAPPRA